MPYTSGRELKEDVLFRASEPTSGSAWNAKVMDYLNRVYSQLLTGASEFTPEFIDDWWWHRAKTALTLEPVYSTGTIDITGGAGTGTFSVAPVSSLLNYRLRIADTPEVYKILSHTAGATAFLLDSFYVGATAPTATFKAMKTDYTVPSMVAALSPIVSFRHPFTIPGMTQEAMEKAFPIATLDEGLPKAFSLIDPTTLRFSHGGFPDGEKTRLEINFKALVTALTDNLTSLPIVPAQWRHVLSDMALVYLLMDKNDDRVGNAASQARLVMAAMFKENRRQLLKIDGQVGFIRPRGVFSPLQTASGLIVG